MLCLSKENTFKTFVEEHYYDKIFNKLSDFIGFHPTFVQESLNDNVRVSYSELSDFSVEAVYIEDKGNDKIDFDVVCKCDVGYEFVKYSGKHKEYDSDTINNVWLVAHASSSLDDLKNIKFYGIEPYEKEKKTKPLNGDMVPIIEASEYEKYAQDIIKKYYGDNYDFSKPINIYELVVKMGLTIKPLNHNLSFEKDKAIFAQVYFEDTTAKFYNKVNDRIVEKEVKANTILFDREIQSVYSYGSEAVTIAHECVHFALHSKAFKFSKYINKSEIKCISCFNDGKINGIAETNKNESFMEAQANGIAPYLVMPTVTLKNRANRLFEDYSRFSKPIEFMDRLVRDIKEDFGVTILLAKKRLKDIGYLHNIGVLEWDKSQKRYIDSYQYKKDSLATDETYSITFDDYSRMMTEIKNSLFEKCYADNFIFVQNHVVYDDNKYVLRDDQGDCNLTEYAKSHMDECALKFKIKSKAKYFSKKNIGTFCYLCKGVADDMAFDIKVAENSYVFENNNLIEKRHKHEQVQKETIRIIEDSKNLADCMNELCAYYDYVAKDFIGINPTTFSRYKNGDVDKADIRKAICICLSFKFTPKVSNTFIGKFSKEGLKTDDEGNAFFIILNSMRGCSIKKINNFLINQGFKPLC